mgnify:FL=1
MSTTATGTRAASPARFPRPVEAHFGSTEVRSESRLRLEEARAAFEGKFQAMIQKVEESIVQLRSEMTGLSLKISSSKAEKDKDVAALQEKNRALEMRVSVLETAISARDVVMSQRVKELSDRLDTFSMALSSALDTLTNRFNGHRHVVRVGVIPGSTEGPS